MVAELHAQPPPERYRVEDLLLDVDACTLRRGETSIALPPRTFELFVELVRRHPHVVRRERLLEALWPGGEVLDEALSQRVMLLRRALGDTAERPRYVALVRKWGYKIVARVERVGEPAAEATGDGPEPGVAVLPFLDLSAARDRQYLCEGLAEEIINALCRVRGIRVIARTSSFAVGGMGLDVREAGRRLGVQAILEGSVRCEGQALRVVAQLVSAADGTHLWSERYDRELTEILAVEDDIAHAVAAGLGRSLLRRAPSPGQIDAAAHQAYLEGRHHFAKGTPEGLGRAAECFSRAVERDPAFALAYDSLAELHWYLGFFGNVPPKEAFSLSTWHALRALELDDGLAQTHALLAMLRKELDYNWPEVDRELERALGLAPASPEVKLRHAISGLLPHGRVAEAAAEVEEVLADDPLSLLVRWWLAVMLYLDRRPERTAEIGREMCVLDPGHFLGHWTVGIAEGELGRHARAVEALERAHGLSGGIPFTLGFLGFAHGRAGHVKAAQRLLAAAHQRAKAGYVAPSAFAVIHVGLRQWDEALLWMERAIEARDPIVMPIRTFPFLDPIRKDARFRALLLKMNLG